MRKKDLTKIWRQVPVDYYQRGVKQNFLQGFWHAQKVATFRKLTAGRNFASILDVGCASGYMTKRVSQIFPKSKITGIDVYSAAIDYAKRHYPKIKFLVADAHKLPFADNSFDLVICYETIEHVASPKKVLQEIKRVLSKNGRAIVAMDSGNFLARTGWWLWEKTRGRVWQGAHLHPFHHSQLEQLIRLVGFEIVKKHFSHFGMEVSFLLKR